MLLVTILSMALTAIVPAQRRFGAVTWPETLEKLLTFDDHQDRVQLVPHAM
jgi:hypothetical protein